MDDFRAEGEGINRALVAELNQIHSRDDLLAHADKLKQLFNELVDVIIRAQAYKDKHPDDGLSDPPRKDHAISDQLRIELNRVLHMEGGREVIEKAQEEALNRLDAFEGTKRPIP